MDMNRHKQFSLQTPPLGTLVEDETSANRTSEGIDISGVTWNVWASESLSLLALAISITYHLSIT